MEYPVHLLNFEFFMEYQKFWNSIYFILGVSKLILNNDWKIISFFLRSINAIHLIYLSGH